MAATTLDTFPKGLTDVQLSFYPQQQALLITLYRPKAQNAFTNKMADQVIKCCEYADQEDRIRSVIVTGHGEKFFCAGADLNTTEEGFEGTPDTLATHRDGGGRVTLAIYRCRKPFIAAMNGSAVGIGITMTLAMDIRVCVKKAKIGALVPEAASHFFLPRLVGMGKAQEWIYTGRVFPAETESQSGLFNHLMDTREQVMQKALEIAGEICLTNPISTSMAKGMLTHPVPDAESAHLVDSRAIFWCFTEGEIGEGVASFFERRKPNWQKSPSKDMPTFYPWWKVPNVRSKI